jgi:hypothetical protein
VRDVTVSFDGKGEIARCLVAPLRECAFRLQPVERAVDFDRAEMFRAEPQPLFLRCISIKTFPPAFVIPAAGADVCLAWHRLSLTTSNATVGARLWSPKRRL